MQLTSKESPSKGRSVDFDATGDNSAIADCTSSPSQSVAEDREENDRCNYTLESEEVLDLNLVSHQCENRTYKKTYFGIRDTQEGQLKQKVQQEPHHSRCGNSLVLRDVVGDPGKTWPDGCEQDGHALTASHCLNTGECKF